MALVGATSSGPLLVAWTHGARRRGLRPTPGPFGMLFRGRSLIGWGLTGRLRWFGLSADGVVTRGGVLQPRRVVRAPRSTCWMVEVTDGIAVPAVGDRLTAIPILAVWPDD